MIDALIRRRPAFLASVTSAEEAGLALAGGADLIDCKYPSAGALGALPCAIVRDVAARIAGRALVSATVGDLPPEPGVLVEAVSAMAATGVDIVKIGFFGDDDARPAIAALGRMTLSRARLVAVLMADQAPDFDLIAHLAANGFMGVMLDTANKSAGRLTTVMPAGAPAQFVLAARKSGLMSGGSRPTASAEKPPPLLTPLSTITPSPCTPRGLAAKTVACRPSLKVPRKIPM